MKFIKLFFFGILLAVNLNALAQSTQSDIKLVVFEGSDWCTNCIRFEKNILSKKAFSNFLEQEHIKIDRLDFPQKKAQSNAQKQRNSTMAETLKFDGAFPGIKLVFGNKRIISNINYSNENVEEFIKIIQSKIASLK